MAQQTPTPPTIILRRPQVQKQTGLSRSSIYGKLDESEASFDPTFPKPISIGPRAVGWIAAEVEAWVRLRVAASRGIPNQEEHPNSRAAARRLTRASSGGAVSDGPKASEAVGADVCNATACQPPQRTRQAGPAGSTTSPSIRGTAHND